MEIKIYKNHYKRIIEIFIIDEKNVCNSGNTYVVEPIKLSWKEWKKGEPCEPTFTLGYSTEGEQFLEAFTEALDKQGIKTNQDAKIQATLEATKYHLEDLRKLLKLK